jgi:pyruvate,water dikinase
MPFLSTEELELEFYGTPLPRDRRRKSRLRYPTIFARGLPLLVRTPALMQHEYRSCRDYWIAHTAPTELADVAGGRARFFGARARHRTTARRHGNVTVLSLPAFAALTRLAVAAGHGDATLSVFGADADAFDSRTATDLWEVSRGRLGMGDFLRTWGYQGPLQGELSAVVWREDPAPVERLLATYRGQPDDASPTSGVADRIAARDAAERLLVAAVAPSRRPGMRAALMVARAYVPLRNVGKASIQLVFDVARVGARQIGQELTAGGLLDDPDDVFFLTIPEIRGEPPDNARELVAFRRARRAEYHRLELPTSWVGNPEPVAIDQLGGVPGILRGIPVSPGVAVGRARVLLDPFSDDFEPGEILVCETTDPSYASYFLLAAGCALDIGGPLSHGAIVARDLGIPCVINTHHGTRTIRTGDRLRVDGLTGTVEILTRG